MPFPRLTISIYFSSVGNGEEESGSHAMSSWTVPIVLASLEIVRVVVLEFLLERECIEFTTERKLAVNLFLADVEVFDVEEACTFKVSLVLKFSERWW
jgi:hypothetical protein